MMMKLRTTGLLPLLTAILIASQAEGGSDKQGDAKKPKGSFGGQNGSPNISPAESPRSGIVTKGVENFGGEGKNMEMLTMADLNMQAFGWRDMLVKDYFMVAATIQRHEAMYKAAKDIVLEDDRVYEEKLAERNKKEEHFRKARTELGPLIARGKEKAKEKKVPAGYKDADTIFTQFEALVKNAEPTEKKGEKGGGMDRNGHEKINKHMEEGKMLAEKMASSSGHMTEMESEMKKVLGQWAVVEAAGKAYADALHAEEKAKAQLEAEKRAVEAKEAEGKLAAQFPGPLACAVRMLGELVQDKVFAVLDDDKMAQDGGTTQEKKTAAKCRPAFEKLKTDIAAHKELPKEFAMVFASLEKTHQFVHSKMAEEKLRAEGEQEAEAYLTRGSKMLLDHFAAIKSGNGIGAGGAIGGGNSAVGEGNSTVGGGSNAVGVDVVDGVGAVRNGSLVGDAGGHQHPPPHQQTTGIGGTGAAEEAAGKKPGDHKMPPPHMPHPSPKLIATRRK